MHTSSALVLLPPSLTSSCSTGISVLLLVLPSMICTYIETHTQYYISECAIVCLSSIYVLRHKNTTYRSGPHQERCQMAQVDEDVWKPCWKPCKLLKVCRYIHTYIHTYCGVQDEMRPISYSLDLICFFFPLSFLVCVCV